MNLTPSNAWSEGVLLRSFKGFSPRVSKQFSKTAAEGNIERVWNKITIL